MHQRRTDLNELILDCNNRRFDGGTEIELIAQIEAQQAHHQQRPQPHHGRSSSAAHATAVKGAAQHKARATRPEHSNLRHSSLIPAAETGRVIPLTNRQAPRWKYAVDALLVGPLQVAVGFVGILTSILAMATFKKNQDEAMAAQSKQVFKDCSHTLLLGVLYTVLSPIRSLKALLIGPALA